MLTLPNGDRLWLPGRVLTEIATYVPLERQRLVQEAPDRLRLLYVPLKGAGAPNYDELEACVRRSIHPLMHIVPQVVDELPRSAGGKYEDVVGLRS